MSRRVIPLLLSLLASSPALAVDAPASAPPPPASSLTLLAEDSYPNNYLEGGVLKGMSVDLLKDAFRRAGETYTMSVLPWARAYESALRDPGTCVFSTAHTPAREASFAWVGPLSTIEMTVVAPREHAPVVAGKRTCAVTSLEPISAIIARPCSRAWACGSSRLPTTGSTPRS